MLHYHYFVVLLRCHLLWLSLSLCMDLTYSYGLPNVANTIGHNIQGNLLPNNDKIYMKSLPAPLVDDTIDEVQKILHRDPTLPRLTKGEIQELYEKIAREELEEKLQKNDEKNRTEHMRALMLVLPFNTDNTTEQNLQELFTRPPITKVVDTDVSHEPIQFVTPSNNWRSKNENITPAIGIMRATTYKPHYTLKSQIVEPSPTTYHPKRPIIIKPTENSDSPFEPFKPINIERPEITKTLHRFSSHYSAKNVDFLHKEYLMKTHAKQGYTSSNILSNLHDDTSILSDEYDISESAPKPVYNAYFPQTVSSVIDSKGVETQSLTARIKPDAYTKFKPLNIGEEIRVKPEVEDYLTRFGIVRGRKRKDLQRNKQKERENEEQIEQVGLSSETAIKKLPFNHVKSRKDVATDSSLSPLLKMPSNTELEKLLKNLRELEKLNIKPKLNVKTTITTPPTVATTAHYTSLVNNGIPKLIEAKKPRRRIDPNIDINFGNNSNKQSPLNTDDDQLAKLLQNLKELEKLQIDPQNVIKTMVAQSPKPLQSRVVKTAATTTVTSTPQVMTQQNVINHFSEQQNLKSKQLQQQQQRQQLLLLQQQTQKATTQTQPDLQQLQRLLLQLQNQEKPKSHTTIIPKLTTTTAATITSTARATISKKSTPQVPTIPNDLWQLRKLLTNDEELEKLFEQAKARQQQQQKQQQQKSKTTTTTTSTSTTTTTTSTTEKPSINEHKHQQQLPTSLNDLAQLQKYLAQIERQQQLQRIAAIAATTTAATTTTTSTTKPTTTTTTPLPTPTMSTTTTTTTTTTTKAPFLPVSNTFANTLTAVTTTTTKPADWQHAESKKSHINNEQLQALINRVQQLESLTSQQQQQQQQQQQREQLQQSQQLPIPTAIPLTDILGFTTRNVKDPVIAIEKQFDSLPINDFANLRTLYKQQLQSGNSDDHHHGYRHRQEGEVEISTAATAVKIQKHVINQDVTAASSDNKMQQFAQRIIDITNDTGTGSSLTQVDPREFIQLQKLLSKVQELERVRINIPTAATIAATSKATGVIEEKVIKPFEPFELYREVSEAENNLLMAQATVTSTSTATASSSEFNQNHLQKPNNLHVVYAAKETTTTTTSDHGNNENNYKLPKTTTAGTTAATTTTTDASTTRELEKLLNNAKELKKLGIKLPDLKSMNINMNMEINKPITTEETQQTTTTTTDHSITNSYTSDRTAVFSLTTVKSAFPRPTKPSTTTTESAVQLPVFSATKIIEDAILRAANKIGVSTELPGNILSQRRRLDNNINDLLLIDKSEKQQERNEKNEEQRLQTSNVEDLLASFSEIDSEIVNAPDNLNRTTSSIKHTTNADEKDKEKQTIIDLRENLPELRRLIKNLQDLQRLNLSSNAALLRQADYQYLQNLKKQQQQQQQQQINITKNEQQDEEEKLTKKIRRQSVIRGPESNNNDIVASTPIGNNLTVSTTTIATTNNNPTRVQLNLNLNERDTDLNSEAITTGATPITAASTAPTVIVETTATTASTEESRNANLSDLEASFGPDPNGQESLPPPQPQKKNGFYFMADWNSFLEVGDGDDQVIVRFSPKIGDPSAFIPVKIP